jgi:hypothetical protein
MSLFSACREIRTQLGDDYFEWYLAGQDPLLAKIFAKIRRVLSMFGHKRLMI